MSVREPSGLRVACVRLALSALLTGVLALTVMTTSAEAAPGAWTQAQINTAVENAVAYIDLQRNGNGSYGTSVPVTETGMALVAYGALANGNFNSLKPLYQTHVLEAITFLLNEQKANGSWADFSYETYGTGIVLAGLSPFAGVNVAVPAAIAKGRAFLKGEFQGTVFTGCSSADGSPTSNYCGGWNYQPDRHRSDESNTGYAIFGLRQTGGVPPAIAAQDIGWQHHIQQISTNPFATRNDGGGGYQPGDNTGNFSSNANDSGSMLFSLAYDGVAAADPNVTAVTTFDEHILDEYELEKTVSANMVYHEAVNDEPACTIGSAGCFWKFAGAAEGGYHYSLFALAKGLDAYVAPSLGTATNWYAKLVDLLLEQQAGNGSWPKDGRDDNSVMLATAFSVAAIDLIGGGSISEYETQTVVSGPSNSLCVNPISGFAPTIGGNPNYLPLTTPSGTGEPFPETKASCGGKATHPVAVGLPGKAAGPWLGSIPGAQWVGIAASGKDTANPAPKYYIYNATFELCENQIASAKLEGVMFADNQAGAFLNGEPIGNQPTPLLGANFNGPPAAGWPFKTSTGFKVGTNTIQFVVYDQTISYTGLDFSATVTAVPCQPQWYSNGKLIGPEEIVPVKTSGALTFHVGSSVITCKVKDFETIMNPGKGGPGTDELTTFTLSSCSGKLTACPVGTTVEVIPHNLPWHTELTFGPPKRDAILGMELEIKCSNGTVLGKFSGALTPAVGKSVFAFGPGSGELTSGVEGKEASLTVTGNDKLTGPPGDEEITTNKGPGPVKEKLPIKETYLALGDSLAFGYSAGLFNAHFSEGEPAIAFEAGYANDYWNLHKPLTAGIQLVNAGCPGETTDSLIGNGPLGKAIDPTGESSCGYHAAGFPLHYGYGAAKSQLEAALEAVASEQAAGTPVSTITLDIGGNDELRQIAKCKEEVAAEFGKEGKSKYGESPEAAVKGCIEAHVSELFNHILTNIGRTVAVLREGAKYGGVNYVGKIILQGGYDAYGTVYASVAEANEFNGKAPWLEAKAGELLSGSRALTAILNGLEAKEFTSLSVCFADPLKTFNPGTSGEPVRLKAWTNMANVNVTAGGHDGPDLHPTPAGYQQLAKVMVAACG